MRARGHLPAPSPKEHMQGVRGREHLPAPVIIFLQVLKKAQEERKEAEKRGQEEAKKGQEERKEAREAARKRKREEEAKAREEAQAKKKKKKKVVHDTGLPEATRMSKEVQNLLLNGGVFNLCLLSLQKSANCELWSSLLRGAKFLQDHQIFYVDMEGNYEADVWRCPSSPKTPGETLNPTGQEMSCLCACAG